MYNHERIFGFIVESLEQEVSDVDTQYELHHDTVTGSGTDHTTF